ncbi:methylmalonyl-CoA epimerase [Sphingobium lactosutens]|nr:VOC family protein [Sphingobium lactosutens]NWK98298.1 methylmalonyl-CoA epimerase [Sphingobium lactosutens]
MTGKPVPSGFFQSAWVVEDIDRAMHNWVSAGVGPFHVVRRAQVQDLRYRGEPAQVDFSVAIAQSGPMQIELIQQHDDHPSHYRDVYAPGEEGFHHVCRYTADFDADLADHAARGGIAAVTGRSGDMRFAFLDTRATLGCMTEIIEDSATMRGFFDLIARSAIDWDGIDPIREAN